MDKDHEYVIKKCAVGYGIYDKPYWYMGNKCEGLHMTARTLEECIKAVNDSGATYILEEEYN